MLTSQNAGAQNPRAQALLLRVFGTRSVAKPSFIAEPGSGEGHSGKCLLPKTQAHRTSRGRLGPVSSLNQVLRRNTLTSAYSQNVGAQNPRAQALLLRVFGTRSVARPSFIAEPASGKDTLASAYFPKRGRTEPPLTSRARARTLLKKHWPEGSTQNVVLR